MNTTKNNTEKAISPKEVLDRVKVDFDELDLSTASWEDLMILRERMNISKEEIEAALSVLSTEFLSRLEEEKINGKIVGNWSVSKNIRYGFDTSIDEAKELGAIKQVVDNTALKKLLLSGVKVPGVKKTEYCTVREVVKNEK